MLWDYSPPKSPGTPCRAAPPAVLWDYNPPKSSGTPCRAAPPAVLWDYGTGLLELNMLLELQVFNVQPARDRRTPGSLHLLHSPEAAASLL